MKSTKQINEQKRDANLDKLIRELRKAMLSDNSVYFENLPATILALCEIIEKQARRLKFSGNTKSTKEIDDIAERIIHFS